MNTERTEARRAIVRGDVTQRATDFFVDFLTGHPRLKEHFIPHRDELRKFTVPEEVFRKIEEINLPDEEYEVLGDCISSCISGSGGRGDTISMLATRTRKAFENSALYNSRRIRNARTSADL